MTKESLQIIRDALIAARDIQAGNVTVFEYFFSEEGQRMTEEEAADIAILKQRIEVCTAGIEVIDAALASEEYADVR